MKNKRIALFGGTFDPIHNGHTKVAHYTMHHLQLDQVVFIPAKRSPLKANTPMITDDHRLQMIHLAIASEKRFILSTCDLDRPAPSYTLDTVRNFRAQNNVNQELFWIIGADAVQDLSKWYRIEALLKECTVITMLRGGCTQPDFSSLIPVVGETEVQRLLANVVETPAIPISSSDVRQRLFANESVTEMLHPEVLLYLHDHHLYDKT